MGMYQWVPRRLRTVSEPGTALGLARHWRNHRPHEDAPRLLTGAYRWFAEGFETPNLQAARELLAQQP